MSKNDFKKLFNEYQQRQTQTSASMPFLDFLEMVKKDKSVADLAHMRMFKAITGEGHDVLDTEKDSRLRRVFGNTKIKSYNFFNKEFFGIEQVLQKLVRYFHSASLKGEESRQVLFLVGPVGAGKSSLIEKLKKGLEFSKPIYYLEGSPMHVNPLCAIPKELRPEIEEILGIEIEGTLDPITQYRLDNEFGGDFTKFNVSTFSFSVNSRKGIGVVPPVDPNNQDTSVLIGSEDISKMDKYSEDDPRVLTLNGAFNAGNRGMVEFIEVFKNEIEYLHVMLTATQEKAIPAPGKHGMIYFDGVILAHSNEAEWNKFKADHTNEAILDRIVKIEVPYVLELSEEIKIYEKIIKKSDFNAHIAPHTLSIASMFAIMTRLKPTAKCDILTKLKLYNGDEVTEKGQTKHINVQELKEEHADEGMNGISTRFIMKALDNSLSDSETNTIHPISVLDSLQHKLKEEPLAEDVKERYMHILKDILYKEYLKMLENDITKAFVHAYEEQAETLFQNYLDHVEAYVLKSKVINSKKEELDPDVKFLASIEEQIGITGTASDGFRQDVMSYITHILRREGSLTYKSYEPLKEAIERKLMASVKDITRIILKSKTRDKKQQDKYNAMVKQLIQSGYNEESCEAVLSFAANNLWKE
ncbi:serine protein kinase [Sediminitomix flava]|uniref:Putative serine protein kinase PrkA n=1 Tax=Sediminitomix flava TaxID=379075 RepID=A0A315Z6M5_SEDFL|nr:serine protein kinase [Sediminitomix flava]PWJ40037.1 putative serine protein kinase PrkA [Sediminitomix flava]